jgi:hypothetical protein
MQMQRQEQKIPTNTSIQQTIAASPSYLRQLTSFVNEFNSRGSKAIGVTLIACAVLEFIFNSIQIGFGTIKPYGHVFWGIICPGYWTGLSVLKPS